MADVRTITAHSLLHGFLELRRFSSELKEWTEEAQANNPPRLFRLRQLKAMFRAFNLHWDPQAFIDGEFLNSVKLEYSALLDQFAELPGQVREQMKRSDLPRFFQILFKYRMRVDGVLAFSHGLMEASGLYQLAHEKAGELNQVIQNNIASIDELLSALISPAGAFFTIEQMTLDYDYPDVDLYEIDSEWW